MMNNNYINKYGKTLAELTWFSLPPAEDPLNIMDNKPIINKPIIEEKPKEKLPIFIPNDIMSNILSYLPPPVIKPEEYSIMNNNGDNGYFIVIKRITPKFVVFDRFTYYENGTNIIKMDENKRSKLRKDKDRRCYYIVYNGVEYIVDNKLPTVKRYIITDLIEDFDIETVNMTMEQYKKLLREYYYYSDYNSSPVNYYWFTREN